MTTITVRYANGAYIATALGKRASCTAGERQAAQALARKLLGQGTTFELRCIRGCVCGEAGEYALITEGAAA